MRRRDRLLREYVEGRSPELPVTQRVDQGSLVDDPPSRCVHDTGSVLHQGDLTFPDETLRFERAGQVDRDEVGLDQDGLQVRHQFDAERPGPLLGHVRVERHEPHAEGLGPLGHHGPDPPQADDAQGLPVKLYALESLSVPPAGLHAGVGLRDVAGLGQEQGEGVLGRRDDVGLGRIHHGDTAAGGGLDVHVVQADPGAPDHPKGLGPFEDVGGDLGLRPHDESAHHLCGRGGAGERREADELRSDAERGAAAQGGSLFLL